MNTSANATSENPSDWFSAALAAHQKGDLPTAIALYRKILEQKADHIQAWLNLGLALRGQGERAMAVSCFERALHLNPRIPGAHLALGAVLRDLGRMEDAAESYEKALKLNPHYVDALVNFGCLHHQQDQLSAAIDCFEKALSLQPSLPRAHWSLARALLLSGDYARGFQEHEWRWKMNDFTTPAWNFPQPLWQGEPLEGRTILLHAEQGAGDTIQFIRYVPMVAERGGRLIVGCPSDLAELVQGLPGVSAVITSREQLPAFDTHAPVMSLPRIFGTTLDSVPAQVPYLTPPLGGSSDQLSPNRGAQRLRLGLVWAGGN